MPFTPFHCGPGALLKAIVPTWFSLSLFTLVQILIDLESLYNLIYGNHPVHSHLHTYLGASIVAVCATVIGKPVVEFLFRSWNHILSRKQSSRLYIPPKIRFRAALIGSFSGAYSHVILDSIMHSDMTPFAPFSVSNHLLNSIGLLPLHIILVLSGLIGVFWILHMVNIDGYKT